MEINRDNLLALIKNGIKRDNLSVSGLEREAGVPKDTIRDFLRGKTQVLRADKLQKILTVLEPRRKVLVSGYVEGGAQVLPIPSGADHARDEVDPPPGYDPSDVIAIRVRGDAMLPVFHHGWVIYYSRNGNADIPLIPGGWQVPYAKADKTGKERFAEFLGKPCVVGIRGGKIMLGTLKRPGPETGYDIINHNAFDLRGITPEWAAKIIFIKT